MVCNTRAVIGTPFGHAPSRLSHAASQHQGSKDEGPLMFSQQFRMAAQSRLSIENAEHGIAAGILQRCRYVLHNATSSGMSPVSFMPSITH